MIELINGNIFDSKCDLLIIPCNNIGVVAPSVQLELIVNDLPYFKNHISAGDISFVDNTGSFSNASMIGYAASVDIKRRESSENMLQGIMKKIKICCQNNSLRKVNIPLLGTGAGRLSAKISFDIMKSEFENIPNILLCVYAVSDNTYNELANDVVPPNNHPTDEVVIPTSIRIKNPRVFISYTGTDIKNRSWVKSFACRLRDNGVDARVDMFHLKAGQDLPQWMTNELIMADKVLLICDKYYAEKADNRKGGVGWETMIIQGDMLSHIEQNKYIPILRDMDVDRSLPIYAKSKYALNWSDDRKIDEEFEELLLNLFDCDIEEGPLGPIPTIIKEKLNK